MTQERKPTSKKKALDITKILADPAAAIGELLESPEVMEKLPAVLAKLPPAAMGVLAERIAEYLPKFPTAEEIAAKLEVQTPKLELSNESVAAIIDQVQGQLGRLLKNAMDKVAEEQTKLAEQVKMMQDQQPALISQQVKVIFDKELAEFEAKAKARAEELRQRQVIPPGVVVTNPSEGVETAPSVRQMSTAEQIMVAVRTIIAELAPTALEFYKASLAAKTNNNQGLLLEVYTKAFAQGNKVRQGEASGVDAAREMLELVNPSKEK